MCRVQRKRKILQQNSITGSLMEYHNKGGKSRVLSKLLYHHPCDLHSALWPELAAGVLWGKWTIFYHSEPFKNHIFSISQCWNNVEYIYLTLSGQVWKGKTSKHILVTQEMFTLTLLVRGWSPESQDVTPVGFFYHSQVSFKELIMVVHKITLLTAFLLAYAQPILFLKGNHN